MGSDPPPFFANLLLYYYDSRQIKDLQKKDMIKASKLCNILHFSDDLNATNDAGIFEVKFRDIQPEDLELHIESGNNAEATFLDLDIKIINKFQIGLFDKRDSFPFSITRMPDKNQVTYPQIYFTCQLELNV